MHQNISQSKKEKEMSKGAFVAGNHLCWFSRNPEYKNMTVNNVLKKDPAYINWCRLNLHHLRFPPGLTKRIKKANKHE